MTRAGVPFKTPDAAAIAAIDEINSTSIASGWEYAGRIYKRVNEFYFATARTLKDPSSSDPGPAMFTNVGTYHTHAGAFAATDEVFSPTDQLKATMARELSYLGTPYRRVLKFTPIDLLSRQELETSPRGRIDVLRNIWVLPVTVVQGTVLRRH